MKLRRPILLVGIAAATVTGLVGWGLVSWNSDPLVWKVRKEWKEAAIVEITRKASDAKWLTSQIDSIKAQIAEATDAEGNWFSSSMLLMKNGEWMLCESICRKENWRIHDLFIGRASDGKWYYSTFHFCRGRLVLRIEDQPDSLAKFISTYSVREFDGRSDECLKRTWPPSK